MISTSLSFEELAAALELRATLRQTITYNNLAAELRLPLVNNMFSNHALSSFFEQIDWNDAEEQRPFRTAVVVQESSGRPRTCFYKSVEHHRGIHISESGQEEFWNKEIADLFDYYTPGQAKTKLQIELSRAQATRLVGLCEQAQRSPQELIEGGLTTLLGFLEHDFAMIREADEQISRGEFFTSEEVFAHINQIRKKP